MEQEVRIAHLDLPLEAGMDRLPLEILLAALFDQETIVAKIIELIVSQVIKH